MIEVRQTAVFAEWLRHSVDKVTRTRIAGRLRRLSLGNPGDVRPVGEGVSEMRLHFGPGYRLYYVQRGDRLVVMLCGGDKRTQDQDIASAKLMARQEGEQ